MRHGFTFIEILITLGVLTMLTSVLLLYGRVGERNVTLTREKAKVISQLLRAKSSSINAIITDEPICGYGIHFEEQKYILFQDRGGDCQGSDFSYTATDPEESVAEFNLPLGIHFSAMTVRDIFFMPPDPRIFFDGRMAQFEEARLTLAVSDNSSSVNIKITSAGQISD